MGLAQGPEDAAQGKRVQHDGQEEKREGRRADPSQAGELRGPDALGRQQTRREVGECPEQIRMRSPERLPPAGVGVGDHPAGGGGVVEQVVEGVGDREDQDGGEQELDQPEGSGQVGLRQGQREPAAEAGEGSAAPHQATVKKSMRFCIQKTLLAVQREAARGSASGRRPLLVRSRSSRIFSSGSTTASVKRGPRARKRFHRASPSHAER